MLNVLFNKRKSFFSLLLFVIPLSACLDVSIKGDKAFRERVAAHLKGDGDVVAVATINTGDWTQVCPIGEYERVSTNAARALNINRDQVKIINTHDEVASSNVWGLMFLYPPNRVEYYRINNYFLSPSSEGCLDKNFAALEYVNKNNAASKLKLISRASGSN